MKAKYTPGPWTTSTINREVLACGTGAARVAKCLDEFDDNPGGPGYGTGEREANARLIAAAPELAEALVDLLAHWGMEVITDADRKRRNSVLDDARAALVKAGVVE